MEGRLLVSCVGFVGCVAHWKRVWYVWFAGDGRDAPESLVGFQRASGAYGFIANAGDLDKFMLNPLSRGDTDSTTASPRYEAASLFWLATASPGAAPATSCDSHHSTTCREGGWLREINSPYIVRGQIAACDALQRCLRWYGEDGLKELSFAGNWQGTTGRRENVEVRPAARAAVTKRLGSTFVLRLYGLFEPSVLRRFLTVRIELVKMSNTGEIRAFMFKVIQQEGDKDAKSKRSGSECLQQSRT
jgi:hypothetical protein